MDVTFSIPDPMIVPMQAAFGSDLGLAARDQLIVEGYSSGKLSHLEVQQLLGLDNRWVADEWLHEHKATMPYSLADLEQDCNTLDRLLGPVKR